MAEAMPNNPSAVTTFQDDAGNYHYIVQVPPKDILEVLSKCKGQAGLESKFDTGVLSKVRHSWEVRFVENNQIRIRMDLQQSDDQNNCVTLLEPFSLALVSNRKIKSRHEMQFQQVESTDWMSSKVYWQATWVNDGSWDDTIEFIHIAFNVS